MSIFTKAELDYLMGERRLARIATVGPDGTRHVAPAGWSFDPEGDMIQVGGSNLTATKKVQGCGPEGARRSGHRRRASAVAAARVEIRGWTEAIQSPSP